MIINIILISCTLILTIILLYFFVNQFKINKQLIIPLIAILSIFSLGFLLRLSNITKLIDIGYFFTEFSHIFGTVMFATVLIIGQSKYYNLSKINKHLVNEKSNEIRKKGV